MLHGGTHDSRHDGVIASTRDKRTDRGRLPCEDLLNDSLKPVAWRRAHIHRLLCQPVSNPQQFPGQA